MEGRRYSEGGAPTKLTFGRTPESEVEKTRSVKRNQYLIPKDASTQMSETSKASECYVDRHFSKKMQQFMLHYSYNLVGSPILSGEI